MCTRGLSAFAPRRAQRRPPLSSPAPSWLPPGGESGEKNERKGQRKPLNQWIWTTRRARASAWRRLRFSCAALVRRMYPGVICL